MPRTGEILDGKFRLTRLVGQGGMGVVYEAEHVVLGKAFAVKLLHPHYAMNPEVFKRFQLEARAAAAVGHRGIVDVYDIGQTAEGAPFLVMELLRGESLADLLERQGTLDLRVAVEIVAQILSALVAVHAKKIVHRDLKPENIFLSQEDGSSWRAKILDFGISKVVGPESIHLTATGSVLGTAHYMSPEQARGAKDLDVRADIWAAGAILYRAVAGRLPFDGDSYNEVLAKILTEPVTPPRSARPEIPDALEAVVLKALAKDRDARYAAAAEFLTGLSPFRTERGREPSPWDTAPRRDDEDDRATKGPPAARDGATPQGDAVAVAPTVAAGPAPPTAGARVAVEDSKATTPFPPSRPPPDARAAAAGPDPNSSALQTAHWVDPTPAWQKAPPAQPDTFDAGVNEAPRRRHLGRLALAAFLVLGLAGVGVAGSIAWVLQRAPHATSISQPLGAAAGAPRDPQVATPPPPPQPGASALATPPPPAPPTKAEGGEPAPQTPGSPADASKSPSRPDALATAPVPTAAAREPAREDEPPRRLTSQEVDAALRHLQPRFRQCIALAQPVPSVVRMRVSINAAGSARYDRAVPSPPANVAACLGEAVGGVRFLGSRVEPTTHVFTVTSAPASERPTKSGGLRSSPFGEP